MTRSTLWAMPMLLLAACGQGPVRHVEDAVVQLNPNKDGPSAGYFTLHGGPADSSLVAVTSEDSGRIEMHETMEHDGKMMMEPVKSVALPARGKVEFKPGGKHLMIFDLPEYVRKSGKFPMVFVFGDNERIEVTAIVRTPAETVAADTVAADAAAADTPAE